MNEYKDGTVYVQHAQLIHYTKYCNLISKGFTTRVRQAYNEIIRLNMWFGEYLLPNCLFTTLHIPGNCTDSSVC